MTAAIVLAVGYVRGRDAFQPRKTVFVNRTADHKHDRAVRASARFFQEATGINLGIVFIDRLPVDTTIESQADALFQDLGLGRKSDGKAVLFVWSEKERLFKIEVSYDLEDVFTDALCKRLEEGARTFMLSGSPYARRDFIVELNVTLKLHYLEQRRSGRAPALYVPEAGHRYVGDYLSGGAGMVGRGYSDRIERVDLELVKMPEGLARQLQPGRTPDETLQRYLASLALGIGEPHVPLLTEASRYYRMDKPHAPGYLRRIHDYIAKAGPARIAVEGPLAAAVYPGNAPVLPIFMRRDPDGLWLVDEPKVWAALHLFQDGTSRLKYRDMQYAFAVRERDGASDVYALFGNEASPPALLPLPTRLRERLREAEARVQQDANRVDAWIALADLLHFEIFWLQASEAVYERIVRLDPARADMQWRLLDIYQMTSDIEAENRQWCWILLRDPRHPIARWWYPHFRKSFYREDPDTEVCRDRAGNRLDR